MLTVSPLAGLFDLPSARPDAGVGGEGFAPLMAGLLGPQTRTGYITTDCTSLPPGGEKVPVATLSPEELTMPSILVAAGSPTLSMPDAPAAPSLAPGPAMLAPPPSRFAPIAAPPADAPAADEAPPPALATDKPRAPSNAARAALLTSVASPLPAAPPPTAGVRPAIDPPAPRTDVPVKAVATSRTPAAPKPEPSDDDALPVTAIAVEPSSAPMPVDVPVTPDPMQILVAPVVAPPLAQNLIAAQPIAASATSTGTATPIDPARQSRVASRADQRVVASDIAPTIVDPAANDASPRPVHATKVNPGSLPPSPASDLPTTGLIGERKYPEQGPGAPIVPAAASVRADIAVTVVPQRPDRPIAIDARPRADATTMVSGMVRPIDQAPPPIGADSGRAAAPPLVTIAPAVAVTVAEPPTQAAGTAAAAPIDVMTSSRPRQDAEALATTPPAAGRASPSPVIVPAAAAPVVLPALQAFGAAMRRVIADERKVAQPKDDTGLGLTASAGPTTPATAQPVTAGAATLDTGDRRWPRAMAEQIEKLRDAADAQSTRIRLLPDALGPVDVSVRRDGEQVHVHFTAAQAETRQLLADAQPRLTDAAEARGVKLGRTDVSGGEQTPTDRQHQQRPPAQTAPPSRPAPARTRAALADDTDTRLA